MSIKAAVQRRRWVVLLLSALALGIALVSSGALAGSPSEAQSVPLPHRASSPNATSTPACGLAWRVVDSPSVYTYTNTLNSVAALSPSDVWAVGHYYISDSNVTSTLIEHWDGTQWNIIPSPNPSPNRSDLYDLAAVSTNDVWAVGGYSDITSPTDPYQHPLIIHWDGFEWVIVPNPRVGSGDNFLGSITATSSNDVWAVGIYGAPTSIRTLVEHWDGTSWAVVPSPNANALSTQLTSVEAVSTNDVWAVGRYHDGGMTVQHTFFNIRSLYIGMVVCGLEYQAQTLGNISTGW